MRLLLDAEQTYMQPAVDALAIAFQRTYNQEAAVLLNIYQCYLKVGPAPDCPARLHESAILHPQSSYCDNS